MPLIIAPSDYERWLSDDPDPGDLMWPFPAEPMDVADLDARQQTGE
jgi:putative SOS response-associated peptidase YedK